MSTVENWPPRQGDEAELYQRYQPRLLKTVMHFASGNGELAEDACSFAWVQLLRHQPSRATAFSWLRTLAIREAWNQRTVNRRKAPIVATAAPKDQDVAVGAAAGGEGDPLEIALSREHTRELAAVLDGVHPRGARYLLLQSAGYSYRDICELEDVTWTAVNRYITEARARVRKLRDTGG